MARWEDKYKKNSFGKLEHVRETKEHGGYRIRDPSIMNLSLRVKIIWRLVSGRYDWWKNVLHKNYFFVGRLWCINGVIKNKKNLSILKVIKYATPLICDKLMWILGNRKLISIWIDNIMGNEPLEKNIELTPLHNWMDKQNLKTLFDNSEWEETIGQWLKWFIGETPTHLLPYVQLLYDDLKGCTPRNVTTIDRRGWGLKYYNVKRGYLSLL